MKQYNAIFDRGEIIVATDARTIYKHAMSHLRWDMHRPQFHGTILHVVIPELGFSAAGVQCASGSRTIVMDKEEPMEMSKWLFWQGGQMETDQEITLEEIMEALIEELERNGELRGEKI